MQVDQVTLDAIPVMIFLNCLRITIYFSQSDLLEQVLKILDGIFAKDIDLNNGRPGMDMWSIFVMGVLG